MRRRRPGPTPPSPSRSSPSRSSPSRPSPSRPSPSRPRPSYPRPSRPRFSRPRPMRSRFSRPRPMRSRFSRPRPSYPRPSRLRSGCLRSRRPRPSCPRSGTLRSGTPRFGTPGSRSPGSGRIRRSRPRRSRIDGRGTRPGAARPRSIGPGRRRSDDRWAARRTPRGTRPGRRTAARRRPRTRTRILVVRFAHPGGIRGIRHPIGTRERRWIGRVRRSRGRRRRRRRGGRRRRRRLQRGSVRERLQRRRPPSPLQPDDADVALGVADLRVQVERLPIGTLRQVEQPQPGGHHGQHQMRLGFVRCHPYAVPRRVQRLLAVATLAEQRRPGALCVRVLWPAAEYAAGDLRGVTEASAVGQRHGSYHHGVDRVGGGRDGALGGDQRLGRLVRRQVDPGERGQQGRVVRRGVEARRDVAGGLVVAAQIGEQQRPLPVLLGSGLRLGWRRRRGRRCGHLPSVGDLPADDSDRGEPVRKLRH
jgi:hypothetical protein